MLSNNTDIISIVITFLYFLVDYNIINFNNIVKFKHFSSSIHLYLFFHLFP